MGRKKVTGRYSTREELERKVVSLHALGLSFPRIGKACRINGATALRVFNTWMKTGKYSEEDL